MLCLFVVFIIMSHAHAFRSHLMQQFIAQSSRQARPPLALTSVFGPRRVGGVASSSKVAGSVSPSAVSSSSSNINETNYKKNEYDPTANYVSVPISEEAQLVQNVLVSRRTTTNYAPKSTWESSPQQMLLVRESLHRAITCAIQAPNHRRTEPWTFKTLVCPSPKRQALLALIREDKRERWENIPAFVVALVHGQPNQDGEPSLILTKSNTEEPQVQHELTFVPPSTLLQIEDYAATCAAVQNLMLSLCSEGLSSKWSTGPITRTTSFRQLVNAKPDELVVGLIMVGFPVSRDVNNTNTRPHMQGRQFRRDIFGDMLQEL